MGGKGRRMDDVSHRGLWGSVKDEAVYLGAHGHAGSDIIGHTWSSARSTRGLSCNADTLRG
jgi:hypothetical protein